MTAGPRFACDPVPKVLFLDIETAPIEGYTWGMREADVVHAKHPTYMLSYAYNWQGQDRVHTRGLCDYPIFKKDRRSDKALAADLWELLDRAEIVVAHNGDAFDIKKVQTRFLVHGLMPPTPFKSIDTLKIARRNFRFDSNKLDNIGRYLQVGKKLAHTGIHLWLGCMDGDEASWAMLKKYNAQDVRLLKSVYEKIKAWDKGHPILTAIAPRKTTACPTCLSTDTQRRGWNVAKVRKTPRYQCRSCGHWFAGWDLGGGKDARKAPENSA